MFLGQLFRSQIAIALALVKDLCDVRRVMSTALLLLLTLYSSASSANTIKVYSLKSKLFVAEVDVSASYNIERTVGDWNIVRFNTPAVPAWLSAAYVSESDGYITVTADRLNLRIGPSIQDRVLTGVAKGFNSKVLARANGFVQVHAPTWVLFSLAVQDAAAPVATRQTPASRPSPQASRASSKWQTGTSTVTKTVDTSAASTGETSRIVASDSGIAPAENASEDGVLAATDASLDEPSESAETIGSSIPASASTEQSGDQQIETARAAEPATEPTVAVAGIDTASSAAAAPRFANVPPVVNEADTIALQHRLSPGDSISLKVFGEADLSLSTVRIPQSGRVSFPLIGSVEVAQKTTKEVENILREALSQGYINDPQLLVSIDSYRPIFVKGAVAQTGAFPYTEGLTVAKVIALAGGAKNSARREGVSISRDGRELQSGLSIDSQYQISSGDILSIEEEIGVSEQSGFYVYLHGEVSRPGEYEFRRGLTVEKAVVLAGGFTIRASRKRISVSRIVDGEEAPLKLKKVDLYMPVEPGDIIDVGASWF